MSGTTKVQGVPLASFVSQVVPEVVAAPFVAHGTTGRSIAARAQDVVSVKDFGAPGSAGADSAPGINAAFAYVRSLGPTASVRVVFPADIYTLHAPVNATGLQSPGIVIDGCGSTLVGAFAGGIIFDFFDTRWLKLRDLTITSDGVHEQAVGLAGGTVGTRVADGHAIENVFVEGSFTLACAYFIGTETSAVRSLRCWNGDGGAASYALIVDGVNHFGISSSFTAQTLAADSFSSFSDMLFSQVDARKPNGGHAIWIGGVSRHSWHTSYVACQTATEAVVLWASASNTQQSITGLELGLHQESAAATDVFLVDGPNAAPVIQGLSYRDHRPQAGGSIFRTAPQITSVAAQNLTVEIEQLAQAPVLFANPSLWTVSGRLASPSSAALVNVAAGQFSGTLLTPAGSDGSALHVAGGGGTARTLAQRAAEVVNVKDYGAPGSAGGDSAPGINAALAYVRGLGAGAAARVVFPADTYTVQSPLNFTGLLSENILIDGCGSRIVAAFNGGIAVDAFNSRWLRFKDLSIGTDGTHAPQIGLAAGKVNNTQNADCHSFENVIVDGQWQLAAAYFIATETSSAKSCKFWNGIGGGGTYGLIVDGINHFGVISTFAPQTLPADTLISFNEMLFLQADIRNGGGTGHAIWIGGAARHRFIASYAEINSATQAVVLYCCMSGSNALNAELYFDLHQETTAASDVFLIDGGTSYALIYGLQYIDHNAQAANSIFKCSPSVTSVNAQGWDIRIISTGVAKIFDAPGNWFVAGDVLLPNSASPWNLPANSFLGRLMSADATTVATTTLDVTGTANAGALAVSGAATIGGANAAVRPTVTVFNSSGSWTPKATSTVFWALIAGGGGGGGGGSSATTAQTASGGGGGGGGACFVIGPMPVAALTGALTVTVGADGVGGPAGTNGAAGGASCANGTGIVALYAGGGGGGGFGAVSVASGGGGGGCVADGPWASGASAAGATAGAGGTPNGQAGVSGTYVPFQTSLWVGGGGAGTPGSGGASGVQANTAHGATGGNSGQGVAANAAVAGVANSGATLTASGNSGYGAAGLAGAGSGGSGGVGGSAGVAGAAGGTGGAGGGPGGGGGGGGASAGGTGGHGGNGAPGQIIIVEA